MGFFSCSMRMARTIFFANRSSPKFFMMENVARLYSHNNHETKNEILKSFESIGYKVNVKILYYSNVRSIVSIWHLDNKTYYNKCLEHHVKYRPFFSPISINPRIARSLVNLSNCSLNNKIVDTFCNHEPCNIVR